MNRSKPINRGKGFTQKPRAPLKRSTLRATAPAKAEVPLLKMRKCPVKKGGCGTMFRPLRAGQMACMGEGCAVAVGAWIKADNARAAKVEDEKKTRTQLEALKTLKVLRAEAQEEFNRFIRFRDRLAGYRCICCGAPLDWWSGKPGGSVDAGHFVSRGSAIELAFDERNVNAQRKSCNRPGGTTRDSFRAGMVERYGEAVVAELEGPHDLEQLRHDDLRAIRNKYRKLANELGRQLKAQCA